MHSERTTGRPAPQRLTAVWLFIVGIFGMETALRVLPEGFMTRTVQHRAEEIRYLPPADIQLMGDSATSAVRAALLEHFVDQGYQVSNYALPGTSPLFNYFVLQRQLAANRAPRLIVLAPHPFVWGDPMLDRFLARFATLGEALEMLRDGVKFSEWCYGALCRISYTLRYREEFYKAVTAGDLTFFRRLHSPVSSVQNTRAKITPTEENPAPPSGSILDARQLPPLLTRPISVHPYNELYLEKFCALAAAHRIQIVWLSLPLPELVMRQGDGAHRTLAYAELIHRITARHPNVAVLSDAVPTLPDSHYQDPWHMNTYGAWVFTQQAGQQLGRWLAAHPLPRPENQLGAAR